MTTHVALVRGINVGGRALVSMAALRELFVEAGCSEVRTYIQSGNVVFTGRPPARSVANKVAARLHDDHRLDVTVILRSGRQLDAVVAKNPWGGRARDLTKLHVTFLATPPDKARVSATTDKTFSPDEFRIAGSEVYVYCPGGYGRTKINNTFFERSLGVPATTRNWNTVTTLARMAAGG
ncbi:MAG TPA: DUF1697 domain-containing protein [Acidimicrobiales bacterium]|nr:DUF1697 domain-containing protein [Acidimicrobiales bacterium]